MTATSVITIGNFDGVHLGHRAIVGRARARARAVGAKTVAMTFARPPAAVLRPGTEPPRLMDPLSKSRALQDAGADEVVMLDPTPALLGLTPGAFIDQVISDYHPVAMVEGRDFRFGHNRQGDVRMLAATGQSRGFDVEVVDPVEVVLLDRMVAPVSSSLVRWLLEQGRVADAALALGGPYTLNGEVVRGEQRGRELGMPTANLSEAAVAGFALPADGVYAGYAETPAGRRTAAISIGVKPTMGGRRRVVEAHLLEFDGDLYEQRITITFTRWLREQQRFASVEQLRARIAGDVAEVRRLEVSGLLVPPRPASTTMHEAAALAGVGEGRREV